MTAIVGVIGRDGEIFMGGDSAGVAGLDIVPRKDPKVFVAGDFIYGFTSSFRMGDLLRYSFKPPDHDPRKDVDAYLRTDWIDAVRKCFKDGGFARKEKDADEGGTFLVGYRGRLFEVEGDFQVGESPLPFNAVGCGHAVAKGAMWALRDTGTEQFRIETALEAAAIFSAGVRAPFVVVRLRGVSNA